MPAPIDDIRHVGDAQRRLNDAIAGFDGSTMTRASRLPGWTVAHVLAHVARNAHSHVRRAAAAARGEITDQYPGGYEGRTAEIDAGAARTAIDIVDDVRSSAERLGRTWAATRDHAWAMPTRDVGGRERTLAQLVSRRWQELEVHSIDLDVGITHRDWPDEFVATFLPRVRRTLATRLPEGAHAPAPDTIDVRDELAWLYGRFERDDLPVLAPWG
jgi:maleylpyruvate isomerase